MVGADRADAAGPLPAVSGPHAVSVSAPANARHTATVRLRRFIVVLAFHDCLGRKRSPYMPPSTARIGAGGGTGQRARQVGDGARDLIGGDEPSVRLACLQRGPFGGRVRRRVEQTAHPRGVRRAGGDRVDANAFAHVVGGHRERQRVHRALAGRVESALREPGPGSDGAGVDDRRGRRVPQVRQRGPGHADHAEHVDVRARAATRRRSWPPRHPARRCPRCSRRRRGGRTAATTSSIAALTLSSSDTSARIPTSGSFTSGFEVQRDDRRAPAAQQVRRGEADAGRAARDDGDESFEVSHSHPPVSVHTGPSG